MGRRYVYWDVARHRRSSALVLDYLSRSPSNIVQAQAVKNKRTPPATLTRLAVTGDIAIRRIVAQNPATPLDTLLLLLDEEDMHSYIVHNPRMMASLRDHVVRLRDEELAAARQLTQEE